MSRGGPELGYLYQKNRVQPLEKNMRVAGASVPLKVHNEEIGRLDVESSAVEGEEALGLLEIISDRLSDHLDGLRLGEQREQALAETELLYAISARLSTSQSLEEALTSVSTPAMETGVIDSRLFIITYDERAQLEGLTFSAIWYPDEGAHLIPVNATFPLSDYPAYRVCLSDPNSPLLIEDLNTDPRLDEDARQLFKKVGAKSMAILPLAIQLRWVGLIFIHWSQAHTFSQQERRLYSTLSRQAAVVVNNRLLLEQTRKRAQELQTVAQVSTAASTILNPQELLQSVVEPDEVEFWAVPHAGISLPLWRPRARSRCRVWRGGTDHRRAKAVRGVGNRCRRWRAPPASARW